MSALSITVKPTSGDSTTTKPLRAYKPGRGEIFNPEVSLTAPLATDADGLVESEALTEDTAMTLVADPDAPFAVYPRKVTITSAADLSAITFTVVGTDEDGNSLTEDITGPNNATVTSDAYFASVVSVTPDTTSASTATVGISTSEVTLDRNRAFSFTITVAATKLVEFVFEGFQSGDSAYLTINDGNGAVTWPTCKHVGGSAPTLQASGEDVIEIFKDMADEFIVAGKFLNVS